MTAAAPNAEPGSGRRLLRVAELIPADADQVRAALPDLPNHIRPYVASVAAGTLLTLEYQRPWWDRRLRLRVIRRLLDQLAPIVAATARTTIVAAAVIDGDRVLVAQRNHPAELAGRWEFPGGKVEPGESPERALVRELQEELALDVRIGVELDRTELPDGARLILYRVELRDPNQAPIRREHRDVKWRSSGELADVNWLDTNKSFVASVIDQL